MKQKDPIHYKIVRAYTAQYTDPIILSISEVVKLGKEEQDEKWKGWIWANTENNSGWIPIQILKMAEDKKTGIVLEAYSAKELSVKKGDLIRKIKSLNGWTWSLNLKTREKGWIPDEIIGL